MRGRRRNAYFSRNLELVRIQANCICLSEIKAEQLEKEKLARLERGWLQNIEQERLET